MTVYIQDLKKFSMDQKNLADKIFKNDNFKEGFKGAFEVLEIYLKTMEDSYDKGITKQYKQTDTKELFKVRDALNILKNYSESEKCIFTQLSIIEKELKTR